MLKEVSPFVDLEIYLNPVMCTKCVQMLFDSFEFKTKCLDAEQRFNGWVSRRQDVKSNEVNLLIKVDTSTDGDEIEQTKRADISVVKKELQSDREMSVNFVALDHDYVGVVPKLVVVPNVKKKFTYKPLLGTNTILKPKKEKPEFLCEKCGQLTKNHHPSLHTHCTDGAVYKCRHCDYMVRSLSVLEKHLETHVLHNCGQCNKNFSSLKILRYHIKTAHLRKGVFMCHVCSKSFKHRYSLQRHLGHHNPDKVDTIETIQCKKCPKTFKYHKNYTRHLRLHDGPIFACGFCGKLTARQDYLKKHIETVHTNKTDTRKKNQKMYNCVICRSKFSILFEYIEHLKNHDVEMAICEICGKTFKDNRVLKMHLQLYHDDKGMYKCETCARGFWKEEYLLQHKLKVHQSDPPETMKQEKLGFEEVLICVDRDKENVVVEKMEV